MASLTFTINYRTVWGERVCLCGNVPELGDSDESRAVDLIPQGDKWSVTIHIGAVADFCYYYIIKVGDQTIRQEWGVKLRRLCIAEKNEFYIQDAWKDTPAHSYLYSSVFTEALFKHRIDISPTKYHSRSVLLTVHCPYVSQNQFLSISGSCRELGEWNTSLAKPLHYRGAGEWEISLNLSNLPSVCEYKFLIVDKDTGSVLHWEYGANRILSVGKNLQTGSVQVEGGMFYRYPDFKYYATGTVIPLFSLRTEDSFGIGDFSDLRMLVDWMLITKQQIIQLLPVNDTTASKTWKDSYPYNAISAYALHPIYLGCRDFTLKNKKKQKLFLQEAKELNKLPELNYERVLSLKLRYGRELYLQNGETVLASDEYKAFRKQNESWLFPYTCYCYLRDKYGTDDFRRWECFAGYEEVKLKNTIYTDKQAQEETQFWAFLQYLLHSQFINVRMYAHSRGIAIKGDIPIGISRNSIDVWLTPSIFHLDTQTGAPPDDFSITGQNWGFPTYNWLEMEKDGYLWWKSRLRKMADYFDAYRIDHILGFFRIWEIPSHAVQGLLGYFRPALPYSADEINRAGIPFDATRMLAPLIVEDHLYTLFGEKAEEIIAQYLDVSEHGGYKLKPHCNTQQKIKQLFVNKIDDASIYTCECLMCLCAEVLFVQDPEDTSRFHPRIAAHYSHTYRSLDDQTREAYNRLYNDFFYHRHNHFWREEAMRKLPALISSTRMMVCGEDLGMVPDCVPSVMQELQLFSLEIERMPKETGIPFAELQRLPYLSVCTTSTHDMSPLRLWWKENEELTQHYYSSVLEGEGIAPRECTPDICRHIVERHLHSSSMWVILPLQDWFSIDENLYNPNVENERINIPANPNHYWRYRMHITLEELLKSHDFNENVKILAQR